MYTRTKRCYFTFILACFLVVAACLPTSVTADVTLPRVIGSRMVLQRNIPLPVWGWADPGEKVTVRLEGSEASTKADKQGAWTVTLPEMTAGGPYRMTVSGTNTIELTDILVGEVWVCSGQSNMEMGIGAVKFGKEEIAAAHYPKMRLLLVTRATSGHPLNDVSGEWKVCTPENIAQGGWQGFSAAGYFFGRELHRELGVPVGLIETAWGGTRIEPWTPPVGFETLPALEDIRMKVGGSDSEHHKKAGPALDAIESWLKSARRSLKKGEALTPPPAWPSHPLNSNREPTGLYNAMVHPLVPFAIRGAIWYQGESNLGEGMLYYEKMKALVNGWHTVWNQGDFPFLYVQLAPFRYRWGGLPDPLKLPGLWEAQTASLAIPNTGMAVIVDIGNVNDIHPTNKQEVGRRLALWALAKTYGRSDLVYSGPLYRSMSVEGSNARIAFDHTGKGLVSRDGRQINWFEIAGEDRLFHPAKAEIDGGTVIVQSELVSRPAAVRYGWHEEAEPNLMNSEGLPASPFRTDNW